MHLAMRPTPCTTGQVHLLVYYIKLKSRLSVRPHFLAVSISAVAAWIDVRLARCDGYVFWRDEVYF